MKVFGAGMKNLSFVAVVLIVTIGCSHNSPDTTVPPVVQTEGNQSMLGKKLESVAGPKVMAEAVVFQAISFGCSQSSHFSVNARVEGGKCLVSIYREQPDFCKAAPKQKSFSVDWRVPEQCEGLELAFENPRLEER